MVSNSCKLFFNKKRKIKQDLLAFPGLGLCRSFCTVIRSSVFTAWSNSWSFPIVIYFTSKASSECVVLPGDFLCGSSLLRWSCRARWWWWWWWGWWWCTLAEGCSNTIELVQLDPMNHRCFYSDIKKTSSATDLRLTHRWWIGSPVCVVMAKTEQFVLENHHQINQLQSRFGSVSGVDAML